MAVIDAKITKKGRKTIGTAKDFNKVKEYIHIK